MLRPDPVLIARFAADWRAVAAPDPSGRALVALSGGADSSALLLLMAAIGRPFAATVDHGLRPEAATEARQAAMLCDTLGVTHATLAAPLPDRAGATANVSARARALRYRLLGEHADAIGARWIVTAHHADDQLETLAMRLNRGAGLRGLSGVRARTGRIVRPLLGWRRAELATIVANCGVVPVDDPTNRDDRFDRARLRKALATADWLDPVAASRSAAALAEAEAAIMWTVDRLADERCRRDGGGMSMDPADVPAELLRRLVERCLSHVDPAAAPRGDAVGRVVARLAAGQGGTLGGVLYRPAASGLRWAFFPAPPRRTL